MPSAVDSEIVLFEGTSGTEVKSATGTGLVKVTSGVMSTVTAPTGTVVGTTDDQTLSGKIYQAKAGTASAGTAPIKLTSGTSLTTPEAGAIEFDGAMYYATGSATSGRGAVPVQHYFRLTGDGSALGPTIADFFGANSAIDLPASSVWELEAHLYYLKTTAGTVTYTVTNSAADYTNFAGHVIQGAAAGIGATGAQGGFGLVATTTAAAAFPNTASLTSAVNHVAAIFATIEMNGAGNVRIRITTASGGGTTTPLRGSFFKLTRVPVSSGIFVA